MNRIKELRKRNGLSQERLAQMLNVHQTAISQWETGRTSPDIEIAKKLSIVFNESIEYLLGLENSERASAATEARNEHAPNTIRIAGRDGRLIEKHLTDEQLDAWLKIIESLPDADF